jgi:hypothetical protein
MQLSIRQATSQDIDAVAEILGEAARWLEEQGMPMWHKTNCSQTALLRMLIRASSSWLSVTVFLRVPSDSSLKTVCSGLMSRRTTRRSFIDSLCEDVLRGEVSSVSPLGHCAYTHPVCAISVWIVKLACAPASLYERIGFRFHSNKQVGLTLLRDMSTT